MPDGTDSPDVSSEKVASVKRSSAGINSIGSYSDGGNSNVITFTSAHKFLNGESVRIVSDTGQIPDGLKSNTVAFAITTGSGISTNTNIKLAKTLNDAINGTAITINEKGGALKVVSRVSDKNSGDIGHPIQFDSTNSQWYVKVATAATENNIYSTIVSLGTTDLGSATPRTFFSRKSDSRSGLDKTYRMRYVIPANSGGSIARPPTEGFILQESNTSIGATTGEIETYFGSGSISNINEQRNFRFISNATWSSNVASIETELPHNLKVGSEVQIQNVTSTENTAGTDNSGFNGTYSVAGISSSKLFTIGINTDPGTFSNDTSTRNTSLPFFRRKKYSDTFYVYRLTEQQRYVSGEQDGIYYLSVLNASNAPTVAPFTSEKFSQPVSALFPQTNRDTTVSDAPSTKCFATSNLIGEVVDEPQHSITRETLDKNVDEIAVGVGLTDIFSVTGAAHTIHTSYDHGLNRVTKLSIVDGGAGYGSGTSGDVYNAQLVSIGSSITGKHATAKITVDGSGTITAVKVMDGGSAYGIGNTMNVVGLQQPLDLVKQLLKSVKFIITLVMQSKLLESPLILTKIIINFIELLMLQLVLPRR